MTHTGGQNDNESDVLEETTMPFPPQFLADTWYAELDAHLAAYVVKAITEGGDPILGWMQREGGVFVWVGTTHALRTPQVDRDVGDCLRVLNARR